MERRQNGLIESLPRHARMAFVQMALSVVLMLLTASSLRAESIRVLLKGESGPAKQATEQQLASLPGVSSVAPALRTSAALFDQRLSRWRKLELEPGADLAASLEALAAQPGVAHAEAKPERKTQGGGELDSPSNDPLASFQWHLGLTAAAASWDQPTSGHRPIVAIVDNGIDLDHPDLVPMLWRNSAEIDGASGVDDDNNGYVDDRHGWDAYEGDGDPDAPDNVSNASHGTHCAGIAAAAQNNRLGVAGMGKDVWLMAVRAGSGRDIFAAEESVVYAVEQGAEVISLSFAGAMPSLFERDVLHYAIEQGAIVVAAAGNDGLDRPSYPAAYEGVISVGATDAADRFASFSNRGATVDVAAPGVGIFSTVIDGYGYSSGTSMSAPLVAGVIGQLLAVLPGLDPAQVRTRLNQGAAPVLADPGVATPAGRVNAWRTVTEQRPWASLLSSSLADEDGDGILEPGEICDLSLTLEVGGTQASLLELTTSSLDNSLASNSSASWTAPETGMLTAGPFEVIVSGSATRGHHPLRVTIAVDEWQDSLTLSLPVDPGYASHRAGNMIAAFSDVGAIGFRDYVHREAIPDGVRLLGSPLGMLYHGSVLVARGESVSDAARYVVGASSYDFAPVEGGRLQPDTATTGEQRLVARYRDGGAPEHAGVVVTQRTRSEPDGANLVEIDLDVTPVQLSGDYQVGIFCDWDIAPIEQNSSGYDANERLHWVAGEVGAAGLVSLNKTLSGVAAINNEEWIYDGFTDEERAELMTGGMALAEGNGARDWSSLIAVTLPGLAVGHSATASFALLAAEDLEALRAIAQELWAERGETGSPAETPWTEPRQITLAPPWPNPFNASSSAELLLEGKRAEQGLRARVYDLLGRQVRSLSLAPGEGSRILLHWDGRDDGGRLVASGHYILRVTGGDGAAASARWTLLR